jgi:uncharacterized protein (TIGR02145 family)
MKQTKHVFLLAVVAMLVGAFCPDKRDVKSEQSDGAVRMRIGKHDYLTFVYGGKRWMVENSKEGTPSGIAYGRDANGNQCYSGGGDDDNKENGYYYTREQAATACPDGWVLPTPQDASDLIGELKAEPPGMSWWSESHENANDAYAGMVRMGGGRLRWFAWGQTGIWWITSQNGVLVSPRDGLPYYYDYENTFKLCSVRCVQK